MSAVCKAVAMLLLIRERAVYALANTNLGDQENVCSFLDLNIMS